MMAKCRACNSKSEHDLCSSKCITIIDNAKDRIMQQRSLFEEILEGTIQLKCKDCGGERKKFTQYCRPCSMERDRQRKREYEAKKRAKRGKPKCANKECNKVLENKRGNAHKYCSDKCKPNYQAQEKYKQKRIEDREREKELKTKDRYEGTINPYFLRRGTPKNLWKDSDTGGAFIY